MKEIKTEYAVEFYDHLERPLVTKWSQFEAMSPLPEVGDTFQVDHEEFPHIAQGPCFEVIRRHFFIRKHSITIQIFAKDTNLAM